MLNGRCLNVKRPIQGPWKGAAREFQKVSKGEGVFASSITSLAPWKIRSKRRTGQGISLRIVRTPKSHTGKFSTKNMSWRPQKKKRKIHHQSMWEDKSPIISPRKKTRRAMCERTTKNSEEKKGKPCWTNRESSLHLCTQSTKGKKGSHAATRTFI